MGNGVLPVQTDVLIVGAGPTGLTLAASLAQLGVDHVLIDRDAGPHVGSKAAAVQPRTLEYLELLGVANGLVADGLRAPGVRVQDGDRTLMRLAYGSLDTPFPFLLLIPQGVTEAHLEARLDDLGGLVHRRHRLISCERAFPGVSAIVAGPDGVLRAMQARYLVGSDGRHSTVRTAAGIAFPGEALEELFALAEVRMELTNGASGPTDATFHFSRDGLMLIAPMPGGLCRIAATLPADSNPLSATDMNELLAAFGRGASGMRVREVLHSSTYRVQERVAERLSDGPVFLAGDAAHTHSPAGGQGMNTGIQDAANLAWKLHEVLTRRAPAELLDTYHRECHPVDQGVVAFTRQITALATLSNRAERKLRNDVIAAAATPEAIGWLTMRLSELKVEYAQPGLAPLSPTPEIVDGLPRPGQRVAPTLVPPAALCWTLAVPAEGDGRMTDRLLGRLAVRGIQGIETTLLVRPDGYLAARDVPRDPRAVLPELGTYALGVEPASELASVLTHRIPEQIAVS